MAAAFLGGIFIPLWNVGEADDPLSSGYSSAGVSQRVAGSEIRDESIGQLSRSRQHHHVPTVNLVRNHTEPISYDAAHEVGGEEQVVTTEQESRW